MRILFVEDSERLQLTVAAALRRSGYVVDVAGDGEEGLWLAESNEYDAIVLDIMLPKMDGLSVLHQLRRKGREVHVLLLTAKDTVDDRVRGLELGADDYLIKPFAQRELLARVEALCRRAYHRKEAKLVIADLEIDTATKTVVRAGQTVRLRPREYQLLLYLARRTGEVATRAEIEAHIYDGEADLMSNVIESAVSALRKKISVPNPAPLIHTRPGLGYILQADPE
ncbi:MAG: response regulator transcription factor [Opitutaceae bacterium]|nr:response regulator transcription factor [Opitutaceae bacterium]